MRLVDEFARQMEPANDPHEVLEAGAAIELFWEPTGDASYVTSRLVEDPAFMVVGFTRIVVLQRVRDEIRFAASRIPDGTFPWWWSEAGKQRVEAVHRESAETEYGAFDSLGAAVAYVRAYLGGAAFSAIAIPRHYGNAPAGWRPQ